MDGLRTYNGRISGRFDGQLRYFLVQWGQRKKGGCPDEATAPDFAVPDDIGRRCVLSPVARSTAGPFRPCDAGPLRTFQQACALLPEQGSDAVCSAVYRQLLLNPDRAKAHLPELIAVMEPLAQDPTDASVRLRLYELRDLLQEDA